MINLSEFKKFFLFSLVGSLIVSALVAVITVLTGEFSDISGKVLLTLFMVMAHSLISLAFIWDDSKKGTFTKLGFFVNILFYLIIASFITSIFGIWDILSGNTVGNLYQSYLVIAFAFLHGEVLLRALGKERYIDLVVYANCFFMMIVVLMLQLVIFTDNAFLILGEPYFRVLAAAAIIDGTLSILTIIFYKIYLYKHPETEDYLQSYPQEPLAQGEKKGLSIWVWLLLGYLVIQIIFPLGFYVFNLLL